MAPPRRSGIPAIVVLVCLPLPVVCAIGVFAHAVRRLDPQGAAALGFAATLGYLATYFPALYLFEPFAIVASLWYTRRWFDQYGEAFAPVIACWTAVIVHTAALAYFMRLGR
jgi:hypothetical protein